MSQYFPPDNKVQLANPEPQLKFSNRKSQIANRKSLLRSITLPEYETVLDAFNSLGFFHGWLQDFDSHLSYRPDFTKKDPFEEM